MSNKIYKTGKQYLGKDVSAKYNELGCAEAVNFIVKKAIGRAVGGDVSTYRMYKSLIKDEEFEKVQEPELGDIILSPTGYGDGSPGHVGIISDNGKIMSNRSADSLWSEHLTMDDWKEKFKSFPIDFYRYTKETEEEKLEEIEKQINWLQKLVAKLVEAFDNFINKNKLKYA